MLLALSAGVRLVVGGELGVRREDPLELSGSGGDAVPMLLQNAGVAKTFDAPTAGQGGSVQPVATLPHSGGPLSLTRAPNTVTVTITSVSLAPRDEERTVALARRRSDS